jgi:hypothetical protein
MRYQWCGSDSDVYNAIEWGPGEPNYGPNEWCGYITLNTGADPLSVMMDSQCSDSKLFICEVSFFVLISYKYFILIYFLLRDQQQRVILNVLLLNVQPW